MNIRENVPISSLTTMHLGGPARYVIEVENSDELKEAYNFAKEKALPVYVLGGGSNIIGRDAGFNGVVIHSKLRGMGVVSGDPLLPEADGTYLYAYSGEDLDDFVRYACKLELSGLESLSAIPGSVGAAPVQNVGAYGGEISQSLVYLEAFDSQELKMKTFWADELNFGYRRSIFNQGELVGRYFICRIVVKLSHEAMQPPFYNSLQRYLDEHEIQDYSPESIRQAVRAVRDSKLPPVEKYASSGSFFKNVYLSDTEAAAARAKEIPVWSENKVASGWLIDHAGLKGQVFHGMRVWDHAALVLVNESARSYADLAAARQEISDIVFEKFNIRLEQEPMELGD